MTQDRVTEIEKRMVENESLTSLVDLIQKDWGLFNDVKPLTLMKELERFRKTRVDGKLLYFKDTDYGKQVFGEYAAGMDVVQQMGRTLEIQQERVSKLLLREKTLPTLMEQMRRELYLLIEMYARLLDMQMEMGLVKRAPKEFSLEIAASKAQQALENAMQSDSRIQGALKDAYRLIEGKYSRVDTRQ